MSFCQQELIVHLNIWTIQCTLCRAKNFQTTDGKSLSNYEISRSDLNSEKGTLTYKYIITITAGKTINELFKNLFQNSAAANQ